MTMINTTKARVLLHDGHAHSTIMETLLDAIDAAQESPKLAEPEQMICENAGICSANCAHKMAHDWNAGCKVQCSENRLTIRCPCIPLSEFNRRAEAREPEPCLATSGALTCHLLTGHAGLHCGVNQYGWGYWPNKGNAK